MVKSEWKRFRGLSRQIVMSALIEMASGLARCMYCEDSMGTDIDHFRPKVKFPSSGFSWSNFYLACSHCNSNRKRENFPVVAGIPQLIDPAVDVPSDHLAFSPSTGEYMPVTEIGRVSIEIFGLNREICTTGRRNAWIAICALVAYWDAARSAGNTRDAEKIESVLRQHPFQALIGTAVELSTRSDTGLLPADVKQALLDNQSLRDLA